MKQILTEKKYKNDVSCINKNRSEKIEFFSSCICMHFMYE